MELINQALAARKLAWCVLRVWPTDAKGLFFSALKYRYRYPLLRRFDFLADLLAIERKTKVILTKR
jgi:hypothetical protein